MLLSAGGSICLNRDYGEYEAMAVPGDQVDRYKES